MASQANLPNLPTGELASEKTTMLQRLAAKIPGLRPDAAEKQTRPSYLSLLFHSGPEPLDHVLLTIGVLAALAAGVPFPLLGILFGELVDDMGSASCAADDTSSFGLSAAIERKVLLVVYVTIANFAVIYVHTSCWSMLSERLVRRIRHRYLSAMLRQEMAFFDTLPAGEVASRLDTDLQNIQSGTAEKVGICISSFSYFVAAYAVSFVKAPKLAGMLISIVPAFLMMAMGGGHFVKKFSGRGSDHIAKATGIASAGLTNIMVVHAFGAGKRLEGLFAEHLGNAQVEGIKKSVVSAIQLGLLYFIAYSANALAFWQGSRLIGDSVSGGDTGTTVGAVYTVIFVLVDASFIISQVAPFLQIFANAASSYGKLETTISRISPIDGTSDDGLVLDSISGDIELRNVSFTYPSRPDIEVIHDLSLHIPANKHTGIVGLSGSGKSTVAGLIGRLYDANQGDVLIDGHSVKDLNVRSLRRFIGTVAQNSALFDRSILENIAHGLVNSPLPEHAELQGALVGGSLAELVKAIQSGASIDEAVAKSSPTVQKIVKLADEAAEDANAYRFIEHFQYGFATTVGATGSQLSGGQKQRVVLARALIRQPAILILDEATASLDSISERIVQEALERVTDNRRTTVTIAHRLSTIKKADNIIVMRDGRIVEQGTPEELLGMEGGAFAAMVKLQCLQSPDATESETSSRPMSLDTIDRAKGYTNSLEKLPEFPIEDEPEDGEEETTEKPSISSLAGVLAMGRPYIGTILIGIVASTVVGGSYSAEAVIFGRTVGGLSTCLGAESIYSNGAFYGLMFFVLALIEFSANVLSTASFGRVAEKLLVKVRVLCLRFLFRQDIQWHESEGRSPSTLLSYISSDANSLAGLTGTIMGVILSILINMIAGIVLAHIIAWKIAVVLLSMIPILLLSGFLRLRIAASFHAQHQKAFAESVGLATEAVTSMRTIASFSLEAEALNVYERSLRGPYEATLKAIAHGNFWLAMAYSIGNLVYALAYWWGAKQIVEGIYTPTQFFTVLPALLFSAQSCGQLLSLAPDVSKATVAASRVLSLLKSQPNADGSSNFDSSLRTDLESVGALNEKGTPKDRRLGASVAFRDVHFSYPSRPEIPILRGLDISIAPGQFCALVGPSGAGKSTIIALLERFYRPSSGSVLLDNRDINKLSSTDFRDTIALVPQDSTLFEGTLRFNLELGARPGVMPTLSDIEDACKLANIHDTIVALPHGYETPCGPLGNQFSGGQLQRLSIARALVRKPKLLLLDESTSALDAESEQAILEGLEAATRGVSVLAIAHRARTVRKAHCIFVVVDGACRERGNHEELMGRSAWYHEMVAHQSIG